MEDSVVDERESEGNESGSNDLDNQDNLNENGNGQDPIPTQVELQQGRITFSLTPATSIGGIIDYSTARGRKMYSAATSKLEDELFNCNAEDLYSFLKALKDRAREYGWDEPGVGILSIPDNPIEPTEFKSLIDQHGEIERSTIESFEETYLDRVNRSAQDAAQLYRCLMASLSKEGKKKILVWESQYTVRGMGSGNLLLKIIVRESHLDTNATSSSIRTKLTDLDRYLPTIGHDITKFNTYVKLLVEGLKSRGETTTDLLVNLFKGYMVCSDKEFVEYIKRKQDIYEEGGTITPDGLMKKAADKYKNLVQKGSWNAPDANEQKILALQSEIKKLKKKSAQGGKAPNKKRGDPKKSPSKKPAWFQSRPKSSELKKPKKWKGVNWYYCHKDTGGKCNGIWRQHKPSDCKGTAYRRNNISKTENDKKKKSDANKKRKLQVEQSLQANQASVERDDDEEISSSDEDTSSDE